MKILQTPFTENHKSAMFFHGQIARGKSDNDGKKYVLETYQDGEISYEENTYVGTETVKLAELNEVFDTDIENEVIVTIYVDKFFAITFDGKLVDEDQLTFNNYDEAIREFKIFLTSL